MDTVTITIAIVTLFVTTIGVYYTYKAFKKNSSTTTVSSIGVGDAIGGDKVGGDKFSGNKTVYEKGK